MFNRTFNNTCPLKFLCQNIISLFNLSYVLRIITWNVSIKRDIRWTRLLLSRPIPVKNFPKNNGIKRVHEDVETFLLHKECVLHL